MAIKIIWDNFEGLWRKGQAIRGTRISDKGGRVSTCKMNPVKLILQKNIIIPVRSLRQFFWEYTNKYHK